MFGRKKFADDRSLIEDLKGLSFKDKLKHLWTYYKWVLVVLLLVVFLIDLSITVYHNINKQLLIGGYTVNTIVSEEGEQYLTDDWFEAIGGEGPAQEVSLSFAYFEDPDTALTTDDLTISMQVVAMISTKELDYVIMDQIGLELYINQDAFLPLSSSLTTEQIAQFEEQLIYHTYGEESDEAVPVAIDISELPFVQECLSTGGPVYIAFPGNRENPQSGSEVLEYLLSWKAQ